MNASAVKVSWERPLYSNGDIIGYYVYKDKLLNGEPVNDKLQRGIIYDQHVSTFLTYLLVCLFVFLFIYWFVCLFVY